MTNVLVLGVDPGNSGAIALLADEQPAGFIDMPTVPRETKGNEINGKALCAALRGVLQHHPGAHVLAIMERVNAMPVVGGKDGKRRPMGTSSAFNFGESFGCVKTALASQNIAYCLVQPAKWKGYYGLVGGDKEAGRRLAIEIYPEAAHDLQRVKDQGRADALLIARWGVLTEQLPRAA